jgi:hypothetical protein
MVVRPTSDGCSRSQRLEKNNALMSSDLLREDSAKNANSIFTEFRMSSKP